MKTPFTESIQNTFRSLEMHSKLRNQIRFCSVLLGEIESFRNYEGFSIFPENFRCNLTWYEGENLSDSSFHHIFKSENFRFPFFYEKYHLTWGVKCEKLNFRKS